MAQALAFSNPIFHDENLAREALEALRWPEGAVCPSCGVTGTDVAKMGGEKQSHRDGLHRCTRCRAQFTVTVGTPLAGSKVPLSKWLRAAHLFSSMTQERARIGSARKTRPGPTSREVQTALGVTYKTAMAVVKVIVAAAKTHKGDNKGFGWSITVLITESRPKYRARLSRAEKDKRGWGGPAIVATGVLESFAADGARGEPMDRTERLVRLILSSGPMVRARKRKKRKPRGAISPTRSALN